MIRIAVYDNTIEHCEQLVAILKEQLAGRSVEIERFPSSGELIRYITVGGYAPDVAFLGVQLWDGDGISLAEKLKDLVPACRIVFLSDSLRPASEVYRVEHVWFILRSELPRFIGPALERALSVPESIRGRGILVKGRGKATFVPLEKLLYLERCRRKTLIRTRNGEYVSSERPDSLLEGEAAGSFIRCHMSYWVNREMITARERSEFVLADGTRIPISRSFRAQARAAFLSGDKD